MVTSPDAMKMARYLATGRYWTPPASVQFLTQELRRNNDKSPAPPSYRTGDALWLEKMRQLATNINAAVRLNVENIMPLVVEEDGRINWRIDDIEGALPPWELCWLEGVNKNTQLLGNAGGNFIGSMRFGVLVLTTNREKELALGLDEDNPDLLHPDERGVLSLLWIWPEDVSFPQGPMTVCGATLDHEGRILRKPDGSPDMVIKRLFDNPYIDEPDLIRANQDSFATLGIGLPLFAFQFANCRNVEVVDVRPNRQAMRNAQRQGDGTIVHSVLTISDKLVRRSNAPRQVIAPHEVLTRAHICRGHFASYTEAAPLFGRYVGRFWRPQHVRGNRKHGEVEKEYTLETVRNATGVAV